MSEAFEAPAAKSSKSAMMDILFMISTPLPAQQDELPNEAIIDPPLKGSCSQRVHPLSRDDGSSSFLATLMLW